MGNTTGRAKCRYRNGSVPQLGQLRPALSQLDCMSTTVPLNVKPEQLGERHIPTRRSLQRSRIINLNLAGRRRPSMRYYRFLLVLVAQQFLTGVALTAVAIYTSTVTPSLKIRDLPHWAGIPLTISGLLGIVFVTRCYGDFNDSTVSNIAKGISIVMVVVSIVLCICAVAFMSLHMILFTQFEECKDGPYPASESVRFAFEHSDQTTIPSSSFGKSDNGPQPSSGPVSCTCWCDSGGGLRRHFIYELIACSDVLALVKFLFIVMSILSCAGALDGCIYVFLLWSFRYKDIYVGVRTPAEVQS